MVCLSSGMRKTMSQRKSKKRPDASKHAIQVRSYDERTGLLVGEHYAHEFARIIAEIYEQLFAVAEIEDPDVRYSIIGQGLMILHYNHREVYLQIGRNRAAKDKLKAANAAFSTLQTVFGLAGDVTVPEDVGGMEIAMR